MLATHGRVLEAVEKMEEGWKGRKLVEVRAAAGFEGWGEARVRPSISPTCSGSSILPSSA